MRGLAISLSLYSSLPISLHSAPLCLLPSKAQHFVIEYEKAGAIKNVFQYFSFIHYGQQEQRSINTTEFMGRNFRRVTYCEDTSFVFIWNAESFVSSWKLKHNSEDVRSLWMSCLAFTLLQYFFFCGIHPVVLYHIKTDIRAAISHNKFYWFRQYMLHVSVVLTVLMHLNTWLKNSK